MKLKNLFAAVALTALSWPATAQLEPVDGLVPGSVGGLGTGTTATQPGGATATGSESSLLPVAGVGRNLQSPDTGEGRELITRGVPGIDGLNASPAAFRNALYGLDPSLIRAVLGETDPAVLSQITRSLATDLPGLQIREEPLLTLPGIDGLPVRLR